MTGSDALEPSRPRDGDTQRADEQRRDARRAVQKAAWLRTPFELRPAPATQPAGRRFESPLAARRRAADGPARPRVPARAEKLDRAGPASEHADAETLPLDKSLALLAGDKAPSDILREALEALLGLPAPTTASSRACADPALRQSARPGAPRRPGPEPTVEKLSPATDSGVETPRAGASTGSPTSLSSALPGPPPVPPGAFSPCVQRIVEFAALGRDSAGHPQMHLGFSFAALGGVRVTVTATGHRRIGLRVHAARVSADELRPEIESLLVALRQRAVEVEEVTFE